MINIQKGTKDVLPEDSYKWQYVESIMRKIAETFSINEIRTPTFEATELFLRGVGDTTDIVNKEMYTFTDKGGRSITLKPEGTAGAVRSFIENGLANGVLPLKAYYLTQCFRYERPQNGRLREFHQFGVEYFGSASPETDAEVILVAKQILNEIGIKELKLYINSIGCPTCRKNYVEGLKDYLRANLDNLCALCRERFEKNPLRILDCKNEDCKKICKGAPKITDYLCDDCKTHFESVKNLLKKTGVDYEVDPFIVRGLDYYTRTVFEFVSTAIGAQGTVLGGGRYDNLVKELGGQPLPAIGFALGIERLLLLMDNLSIVPEQKPTPKAFIGYTGESAKEYAFILTNNLRKNGVIAECELIGRSVKAQLKYADKKGAKYVIIIGDNELSDNSVSVKKMADGSSQIVSLDGVIDYLKNND